MGRKTLTFAVAAAGLVAASSHAAPPPPSIDGRYLDSGGYVEITVAQCGSARCGTITRIVKRKPGEPLNDAHNDNPALRDRPLKGITILKDLRWDDDAWKGEVYNPEDGDTYKVFVKPRGNGALEVKGCVAFFCQTKVWPAA